MIEVKALRFAYGNRTVLSGVSFALGGGLTALMGPNGAGKTTLIRCLLGLDRRYQGDITLDGRDLRHMNAARLAGELAYIPQRHYPAFNYSALDMVLMGAARRVSPFGAPSRAERDAALAAMARMGVADLAQRGYMRLSGGEQQLVLIARALNQQAKLLMMDEPTASLDYGHQHRVMRETLALARDGYTVLMSTHSPQLALSYADRALALMDGRLVADGAPGEVLDAATLQRLYGQPVALYDTPNGKVVSACR